MKKSVSFLVLLMMFVVGCSAGPIGGGGSDSGRLGFDPYTGTKGLELTFAPGSPPSIIYAGTGDRVPLILELRNKGATELKIGDVDLYLSGFDPNIIRGLSTAVMRAPVTAPLSPVSEFNREGGFDVYGSGSEMEISSIDLPKATDHYTPRVQVTACYPYETKASATVCLDPDPFSMYQEQKICQVTDANMGGGQGGPLEVTRIEHEIVPQQKMLFKIYVKNSGNGRVISNPNFACDKQLSYDEIDSIDLNPSDVTIGAGDVVVTQIKPQKLKLTNNQGIIYIETSAPSGNQEYTTPMQVNLRYGYKTSISTQLNIKNIGNR